MTAQLPLLDWQPPPQIFGDRAGITFDRKRDLTRLNAQAMRVFQAMQSGEWKTLREISEKTGDPEASVSARLRDLRSPKLGGFDVQREYVGKGLWRYRVLI